MNNFNWIKKIEDKQYRTPISVKTDKDYFPELKNRIKSFISELKNSNIDNSIVFEMEEYSKDIIIAIEHYYQGNIALAQETVKNLISSFNGFPAITPVNECLAFSPFNGSEELEVQFFRARLSENVTSFPAKEMLHIPFNKREIIKSERFSIPGLPCLYLANSSYCCWIEMGSPADHRFNVSPIVLDNTQKILNLTVPIHKLIEILTTGQDENHPLESSYVVDLLKLFLLTLSTSFKINCKDRNFKSEYILSQLIMLAAKDIGIDGISYLSKQVTDDLFSSIVGVNVVLFAAYNGEEGLSDICNHIKIADSYNFSMFKQLLACQTYRYYPLRISNSPYITNIGSFERQIPYDETQFFEFDKYVFANWKH